MKSAVVSDPVDKQPTGSQPPPRRTIAQLKAGDRLEDDVFLLFHRDLRTGGNGGLYIHAILADSTGQVTARLWNATQDIYDSILHAELIHVRGRVEIYRGNKQLILDGVRLVEPGTVSPGDFLPRTRHDIPAMWERTKEILRSIRDPHLLALISRFVRDKNFAFSFQRAPAARQLHHAFVGGLLEHTLNVLELAVLITPRYPDLNRDLILAGIFLHDAGKVRELSFERNFEYTTEGQLVGHIVQAALWIHEKAAEIESETGKPFPPRLEILLKHLVLAHHGHYEFGSPRLPAIPEALVIHYLDNLDAKIQTMQAAIDADPDVNSEWTGYVSALSTRVYKGSSPARPESREAAANAPPALADANRPTGTLGP